MIKEAMNSQQPEKSGSTGKSRRPPSACESCIEKDETVKCDHCFICGSSEHENETRNNSHLTPKEHTKISRLVGNKCTVDCKLNRKETSVLWDTGSQISLVSSEFVKVNFPDLKVKSLKELLKIGTGLELRAANDTPVPYHGFIELDFELIDDANGPSTLKVPFLVSDSNIANPIIGYNVIEETVKLKSQTNDNFIQSFQTAFQHQKKETTEALINAILEEKDTHLAVINSPRSNITVQPKQQIKVSCHGNAEITNNKTPLLFLPDENGYWLPGIEIKDTLVVLPRGRSFKIKIEVYNSTEHPVTLQSRTLLGRVELIKSVAPLEVKMKSKPRYETKVTEEPRFDDKTKIAVHGLSARFKGEISDFLEQFDLSMLTNEQKQVLVLNMHCFVLWRCSAGQSISRAL